MHRRTFIRGFTGACVGALALPRTIAAAGATARSPRIGCTTVSYRQHFAATRPPGVAAPGPDFDLLDMPARFVDRLGIRNVEVWSKHFAEVTPAYGARLRTAAERAGARIINIQLDEPPFDLCDRDPAKRQAAVDRVGVWLEVAAACGAPSLRANTGGRPADKFDLDVALDSYRRLTERGEKLGVKILVENHGGFSANVDNVAAIVAGVNRPGCRSLPDYGNFPPETTLPSRLAQLERILPAAALISVKGMEFDAEYRHLSFDVGACVRATEAAGFTGIYSVELWSPRYIAPEPERAIRTIADIIEHELPNLSRS